LTRIAAIGVIGALTIIATPAQAQGPAGCPLDPLTLPLFDATPPAAIAATPLPVSSAGEVSDDAVAEAVEIIVTCANDADPAVAWSIFTERYLAQQFADPTVTNLPAFEQFIDVGDAQAPGSLELTELGPITTLDDGRVSVEVTVASGAATFTNTLVLAFVDDAWLIDEVLDAAP
jgi:hypothetical protein